MLNWVTTATLSSIETGFVSELSVSAESNLAVSEIKYHVSAGDLPPGLTLQRDGTIFGRVEYDSEGIYSFIVTANDIANSENSTQTFNLTVISQDTKKYTQAYFKPLLSIAKREEYRNFIYNKNTFPESLIYRYNDPNFGIQYNLKMILDFGLEQINLDEYTYALAENFYRKRIRLGSVKSAIAKNSNNEHIYDVIYADVIDELVNSNGISIEPVIHFEATDELFYPASIDNMRNQLQTITLQDRTRISVREDLQPQFMLTQQYNDYRSKTYMRVVPICYTLPGKSSIILNKIKNTGFKFNRIDFEIDRIYLANSLDNSADKYIIFNRQSAGSLLDTDSQLFGPEGWVRLDDENDQPLNRE